MKPALFIKYTTYHFIFRAICDIMIDKNSLLHEVPPENAECTRRPHTPRTWRPHTPRTRYPASLAPGAHAHLAPGTPHILHPAPTHTSHPVPPHILRPVPMHILHPAPRTSCIRGCSFAFFSPQRTSENGGNIPTTGKAAINAEAKQRYM